MQGVIAKVSFAHNPKCSARIQKSGVRIQNSNVSYEVFLFFVAVTRVLVTKYQNKISILMVAGWIVSMILYVMFINAYTATGEMCKWK